MPVCAFEGIDGRTEQRSIANSWHWMTNRAQREIAIRLKLYRVHQRHIDMLSFSGRVAMAQGSERGKRAVQAGKVVSEIGRAAHRSAVR
jgi:hypothetical protein